MIDNVDHVGGPSFGEQQFFNFLEVGTWDEGKTDLMYELVASLPNYKKTDPEPRLSLTLPEIWRSSWLEVKKAFRR